MAVVAAAAGLAAVSGIAGTGARHGEPAAPAAFRLADGSVGCRFVDAETLACRAAGSDVAAVLAADGSSRAADDAVDWNGATPVLLPAQSWWHGAFSCRVGASVVTCAAGDGAITVERGGLGGVR